MRPSVPMTRRGALCTKWVATMWRRLRIRRTGCRVFPVEGPELGPAEEPAVAEVDPNAVVDETLGIDVNDARATERERAKMVERQLAHLPATRYCEACLRGNMHQIRHHTGASNRSLAKFGQIVTLHHLVAPDDFVRMRSPVISLR